MENISRKNAMGVEISINPIMDAARKIVRGQFLSITYMSEPQMRKTNNPFLGDCVKVTLQVLQLGVSYKNSVENRSGEAFVPQAMSGKHHIDEFIAQSNKDENQYYLCLQVVNFAKCESKYFHKDGTPYTATEVEAVKAFFPAKYESKTQAAVGLTGEEQVKPFQVKIENVLRLSQTDCLYEYEVEAFAEAFA